MNIFLRELKANRKALIIWSVCMFLLVLSGMGKYTAYTTEGANSDVFNSMPYSIKALLGFGSLDVTTISGFFALLFFYVEITAAIHAVLLGSGIIAKEERDKTTEFLMVKPVSRTTIITSKLLAALANIAVINIVALVSSIAMVSAYNKGEDISGVISIFYLSMFIVQLIFLSLGAALSSFIKAHRVSGQISAGILFVSFAISRLTDLNEHIGFLNVLSPFKYFSYQRIIDGNGLNFSISVLSLLLVALFTSTVYYYYSRRNLNV